MVCSTLLTILAMGWEKNFIVFCKGEVVKTSPPMWPELAPGEDIPDWSKEIIGIKVDSKLERFSTEFGVLYHIQTSDGEWHVADEYDVHEITKWFNVEGFMVEDAFQKWTKDKLKNACKAAKEQSKAKTKGAGTAEASK